MAAYMTDVHTPPSERTIKVSLTSVWDLFQKGQKCWALSNSSDHLHQLFLSAAIRNTRLLHCFLPHPIKMTHFILLQVLYLDLIIFLRQSVEWSQRKATQVIWTNPSKVFYFSQSSHSFFQLSRPGHMANRSRSVTQTSLSPATRSSPF